MWQCKNAKTCVSALVSLALVFTVVCHAQPATVSQVQLNIAEGQFIQAQQQIEQLLLKADPARKSQLQFEQERMRRIKLDFPYDASQIGHMISA